MMSKGLDSKVETISPKLAESYLLCSAPNRPVRNGIVERYAREISLGHWQLDGQAIKFDTNDQLIDGQHRLKACAEAKTSFQTLVLRGLEPKAFNTLDQGAARRATDYLALRGEDAPSLLERGAALIWKHKNVAIYSGGRASYPTIGEIFQIVDDNPDLRDTIKFLRLLGSPLRKDLAVGLHYIFSQANASKADEFFEHLSDGANLVKTSPILLLRKRLSINYTSKRKLSRKEILALSIKAWNAFLQDAAVHELKWRSRGPSAESFPVINKSEQQAAE